jgi:hypothetical protein
MMTDAHHVRQDLAILEDATHISGRINTTGVMAFPSGIAILPGAWVKFPEGRVVAADRVGMWVDAGNICMSVWPCELQPQYKRVYSDPKKVEALIALGREPSWELNANFHLAHRFAAPEQRWYPGRHLAGPAYVRQWIDDFREGRAKGRSREQLQGPSFRRWLVERGYATDPELTTLDEWLNSKSSGIKFHIRPGVQVLRTWKFPTVVAQERRAEFVAEVRRAIDQALTALGEPDLAVLRVEKPTRSLPRRDAGQVGAAEEAACPMCQTVHAGECL